jgi:zinc transporter ZupT
MNGAAAFYGQVAIWLVVAIALAVTASYFLRARTRALYPGGPRRYLLALVVQATGFMAPIPIVLVALLGRRIPPGLDVVLAVLAGVIVILVLRSLPRTGALLKDLHRARVEAAMERLERKS